MTAKNGARHFASIDDDRHIHLDGDVIRDVAAHPKFDLSAKTVAALYDFQAAPENIERMTFEIGGGRRVNQAWRLPRNYGELVERRLAMEAWAEQSFGWFGRSPDCVASTIAGMYMGLDVYDDVDPKRGAALRDYYHHAREQDLYLTYVLVNPHVDRSAAAREQGDPDIVARIVDEAADGITIRGAKLVGTGIPFANEILVGGWVALRPGDEDYCFTAMVPVGQKGVQVHSRRSYQEAASSAANYPLSANFDENDSIVYFDDVKVPWDRVFVYRDLNHAQAQWHDTRAHVLQNYQGQVRLMVKLRFLAGIARRLAESTNVISIPQVRDTLGWLAAQATMFEAMVQGMESRGENYKGYYVPDRRMLVSAQVMGQELYPEIVRRIRELAGGGLIVIPSAVEDLADPDTRKVMDLVHRSPVMVPDEKMTLLKLAWDALGSEFAGRHMQYEMFYNGANFVTRGHNYRFYDWDRSKAMVGDFVGRYCDSPASRRPLDDRAESEAAE